jgi:hypothetical protein
MSDIIEKGYPIDTRKEPDSKKERVLYTLTKLAKE